MNWKSRTQDRYPKIPPKPPSKERLKRQGFARKWFSPEEVTQVIDEHHLEKTYVFPHFRSALSFTNKVSELAEREGHHPDIYLAYGKVKISLWTHKINGLSESDFILAAKCDEL